VTDEAIYRLRLILIEKIREAPAENLDLIKEYIKEIKDLEVLEEEAE
jgi:hypothetical protein